MKISELLESNNNEWEVPFYIHCENKNLRQFEQSLLSLAKKAGIRCENFKVADLIADEREGKIVKSVGADLYLVADSEEDAIEKGHQFLYEVLDDSDIVPDEWSIRIDGAYK